MFTYECNNCGYISDFEETDPNLPHGCPRCDNDYGPLEQVEDAIELNE